MVHDKQRHTLFSYRTNDCNTYINYYLRKYYKVSTKNSHLNVSIKRKDRKTRRDCRATGNRRKIIYYSVPTKYNGKNRVLDRIEYPPFFVRDRKLVYKFFLI